MSATQPSSVLNEAFEEVGLILGGFLAQTPVRDHAVWKVAGEVSQSWFRATSRSCRLGRTALPPPQRHLHPAIQAMLAAIRSVPDDGAQVR